MADEVPGAWQRAGHYFRRRHMLFAGLAVVFVAGVLAGAVAGIGSGATTPHPMESQIERVWQTAPPSSITPDGAFDPPLTRVLRIAATGAGGVVYVIGGCMLMALSIIGAPFALAVLFWRGFGLGYTALLLIDMHGWRGGFVAAAVLGPHNGFNVPGLILAVGTTMELSWRIIRILFGSREGTMGGPMLRALIGWSGSGILFVAGALTEAYVSPGVAGWIVRGFLGE